MTTEEVSNFYARPTAQKLTKIREARIVYRLYFDVTDRFIFHTQSRQNRCGSHSPRSRRRVQDLSMTSLFSITAIFCALLLFGKAHAADKLTLGTDWRAQAEHGGYYQALATGLYDKAGIELTIRQGGPQINHSQLLAAGKLDISIAPNSFIPLNFAQQKVPVVAIASIFQKDPAVLIAHPRQGNDSLAALRGKKIMISPDTRIGFWRFLKSSYGYTDDQIAPYTFNLAPFLADPKSIQQGYATSEPFQIERIGIKPVVMLLSDAGYTSYASLIVVPRRMVQGHRELVQRFVDATILGWASYLSGDPSAANALIKLDNPEMTDELLLYGRDKLKTYAIIESGEALTSGIGAMNDARWNAFFDVMASDGLYPRDMDYRQAYTLDFVGKGVGLGGTR
jgi:NitT/TauT family transport system substrate-binding protein